MKENTKRFLNCGGKFPQRIVLALMLVAGIVNLFTMRICLSVAIVRMVKPPPGNIISYEEAPVQHEANFTQIQKEKDYDFDWTQKEQGLILSSFYWGYTVSHIPGGCIADRFGGKYTMLFGVGSTTLTTLLTPIVTRAGGSIGLMILRIVMGLGEGVTFPAVTVMLAKWAPQKESSRIGAFVLAASQLGTVIATSLSGVLLDAAVWDHTFYVFGLLGFLWCVFWLLLCYSVPSDHPFISDKELAYLNEAIKPKKRVQPVPWKSILTALPVWALIVGQFGHDWGFFTMVTYLPKYLNDVLHVSIKANGFLSALPSLIMWACSVLVGFLADYLMAKKKCTVLNLRRYLTLSASVIPAVGILSASYTGTNQAGAMTMFTLGMAGMSGYYPGMRVNPLDISRNYAGTVMALNNGLGAIAGIVSPIVVGLLTPHGSLTEWRIVFIIAFVVLILSGIFYAATAKATIQKWDLQEGETLPEEEEEDSKAKKGKSRKDMKGEEKPDEAKEKLAKKDKETAESQSEPKKKSWWWPF